MRVAVVVPAYNERTLLPRLIARLDAVQPPRVTLRDGTTVSVDRRLIVVDDGSTDGTAELVKALDTRTDTTTFCLPRNAGKGAAVRLGFAAARDLAVDAVIVQDADLEYDPADHAALLQPIADGRADFVVGNRFHGPTHRAFYYWHSVANRALTTFSNMLSDAALSDIECGLKCLSREVLARVEIEEDRFGIEPELVAKVARMRFPDGAPGGHPARIYEVAVSYDGRTYAEGKKITWRDGLSALRCVVKYNLRPFSGP